jgi:pimeloyl-ACP methyl ester carboxylesterase
MSVSEALGQQREVKLPQGTVRYRERGEGEPIVFVHGLLVNGDLWRKVVPLLADRYRCITPDWPLGSHSIPLARDADLTPPGLAQLIADFMAALDLDGVTVVGNDTGTALSQLVAASHPERVGRLVLTTGDAFDNFPPKMFKGVIGLGYLPGSLWLLDKAARPQRVRRISLAPLAKTLRDPEIFESYAGQVKHAGIRHDLAKVLRALRSRYTVEAAEKLKHLEAPLLAVWAPEDRFFPDEHAERLAELVPDGRVVLIRDSMAFVSEDQPKETADAIGSFVAERPVARAGSAASG